MRPFVLLLVFIAWPAMAAEISGMASVVDSDTIKVDGKRIMLFGMESVERNQSCTIDGKPWACYAAAVRQLEILVADGPVTCVPVGKPDVYGRLLARCETGGRSLNEAFVRTGYAVAREDETKEFIAAEKAAAVEKIGLWQGEFQKPVDYRWSAGIFVDRP